MKPPYLAVEKLRARLKQAIIDKKPCMAKIVQDGKVVDCRVMFIYDQNISFGIPNNKGGHVGVRLSFDEFEYPIYSTASRAAVSFEAAKKYPIDEKMNESKRKKQEALQNDYIDTHWYDIYERVYTSINEFYKRQKRASKLTPIVVNTDPPINEYFLRKEGMSIGQWVVELDWHAITGTTEVKGIPRGEGRERVVLSSHNEVDATIRSLKKKFAGVRIISFTVNYERTSRYTKIVSFPS